MGDYIYIVQYPRGGERQDSYAEVIGHDEGHKYVHYTANTDYGSSGSPVFKNDKVLALHHQRVPKINANKGVCIEAILPHLYVNLYEAATDLNTEEAKLKLRQRHEKLLAEQKERAEESEKQRKLIKKGKQEQLVQQEREMREKAEEEAKEAKEEAKEAKRLLAQKEEEMQKLTLTTPDEPTTPDRPEPSTRRTMSRATTSTGATTTGDSSDDDTQVCSPHGDDGDCTAPAGAQSAPVTSLDDTATSPAPPVTLLEDTASSPQRSAAASPTSVLDLDSPPCADKSGAKEFATKVPVLRKAVSAQKMAQLKTKVLGEFKNSGMNKLQLEVGHLCSAKRRMPAKLMEGMSDDEIFDSFVRVGLQCPIKDVQVCLDDNKAEAMSEIRMVLFE